MSNDVPPANVPALTPKEVQVLRDDIKKAEARLLVMEIDMKAIAIQRKLKKDDPERQKEEKTRTAQGLTSDPVYVVVKHDYVTLFILILTCAATWACAWCAIKCK